MKDTILLKCKLCYYVFLFMNGPLPINVIAIPPLRKIILDIAASHLSKLNIYLLSTISNLYKVKRCSNTAGNTYFVFKGLKIFAVKFRKENFCSSHFVFLSISEDNSISRAGSLLLKTPPKVSASTFDEVCPHPLFYFPISSSQP